MGYGNGETGRKAFDKHREEKVSAINLRCQELGIGINDALLNTARFDALQNFLLGEVEYGTDEETGLPVCTKASGDRMEFEMKVLDYVLAQVNTAGVAAAFDPTTERKKATGSGLVLPGGFGG